MRPLLLYNAQTFMYHEWSCTTEWEKSQIAQPEESSEKIHNGARLERASPGLLALAEPVVK